MNEELKKTALDDVKRWGTSLEKYSKEFRNDKEIVLTAVKVNGYALEFASKEMQNDKEVVLAAVMEIGFSLEFASTQLRNNREIALAAVQRNGLALEFVGKKLRSDREIVLAAVQNLGNSFKYANPKLKSDIEIVLTAMQEDISVFCHITDETANKVLDILIRDNVPQKEKILHQLKDSSFNATLIVGLMKNNFPEKTALLLNQKQEVSVIQSIKSLGTSSEKGLSESQWKKKDR